MDTGRLTRRVNFFKIPIDNIPQDQLDSVLKKMIENGKTNQISFVNVFDIIRCAVNKKYKSSLSSCSLVIPVSKILTRHLYFKTREKCEPYFPFDFVIKLLGFLENSELSLYLLGGNETALRISSANLRDSFPSLRIVGRYVGFFKESMEKNIIMAIKKAAPTLLLASNGIRDGDVWINRSLNNFNPGLFLWYKDCFKIFAGITKRPAKKLWLSGIPSFTDALKKPWRLYRLFPYFIYVFFLLFSKREKKVISL